MKTKETIQAIIDTMDLKGWTNFTEDEMYKYYELMKEKAWAIRYEEEWTRREEINEYHKEEAENGII